MAMELRIQNSAGFNASIGQWTAYHFSELYWDF
jgi:hypothetical protein